MFGRRSKVRKAVQRALARVHADDDVADHAPIEALPAALQVQAYYSTAVELHHDERYAAAARALAAALALAPDEVDLHRLAAGIAGEQGDRDAALASQRRVVALAPRDLSALVALAELLIDTEQPALAVEALRPMRAVGDPELETRLAEALFLCGENAEALAILDEVCALYEAQLKQLSAADWQSLKARSDDAHRLRDDVYAELHGREATIDLHAAAGTLDAKAGVNYRLLGARLAATGARIADVLELEPPDATERRGAQRLAGAPDDAHGLVLVGSAQLRRGEVTSALRTFERACELDGRCFAAFLGFGAALDHDQHALHRRAARLATARGVHPALATVVPDLAALTEVERTVVWASAQPLAPLLGTLAERGVTIRILPIDVRATDVGLFEEIAGERGDDHRSYDAIEGVATHHGAVAKIEGLLDVITDAGWTFAHELAHLAFFHMNEAQAAPILELYERACAIGYANTEYALSNPDELFAVSYTEYLCRRHDLPGAPDADHAGIHRALDAYFAGLSDAPVR